MFTFMSDSLTEYDKIARNIQKDNDFDVSKNQFPKDDSGKMNYKIAELFMQLSTQSTENQRPFFYNKAKVLYGYSFEKGNLAAGVALKELFKLTNEQKEIQEKHILKIKETCLQLIERVKKEKTASICCNLAGYGLVTNSYKGAWNYFMYAAELGDYDAAFELIPCLKEGKLVDSEMNFKTFKLIEKLEKKHETALIIFEKAICYAEIIGVNRNLRKALELADKAIKMLPEDHPRLAIMKEFQSEMSKAVKVLDKKTSGSNDDECHFGDISKVFAGMRDGTKWWSNKGDF